MDQHDFEKLEMPRRGSMQTISNFEVAASILDTASHLKKTQNTNDNKATARSIQDFIEMPPLAMKPTLQTEFGEDNQRTRQAAVSEARLQEMLQSEDRNEKKAGAVIRSLLERENNSDKLDGKQLLAILATKPELARSIVTWLPDADARHKFLEKLFKRIDVPESRKGILELLKIFSAPERKEQAVGQELVELLSGTPGQRKTAAEILDLLGSSNDFKQNAGRTIITKLNDSRAQRQILYLMASKEHGDAAKQLLAWLNGDAKQSAAARGLLTLRGRPEEESLMKRLELPNLDEDVPPNPMAERLLKMISDKNHQESAKTILTQLGNQSEIKLILDILSDNKYGEARKQLLSMLQSKDGGVEQQSAKRLLSMLNLPGARSSFEFERDDGDRAAVVNRETGEKLLKMLGDRDNMDAAKRIMQLEPVDKMRNLLALLETDKATGRKMLTMLADRSQSEVAQRMLSDLSRFELKKMIEILSNCDQRNAAGRLKDMLDSGATRRVLEMLTSLITSVRRTGEEILKALNDPRKDWTLDELLRAKLPARECAQLRDMLKEPADNRAARTLLQMASSSDSTTRVGVKAVLTMLVSEEEATQRTGKQILEMIDNSEKRDIATRLIAMVGDSTAIERMVAALNDPKEKAGAEQLIKMLGIFRGETDLFPRDQVREVMLMLSCSFPFYRDDDKAAAERILKMLASEKEKETARRIINTLNAGQYAEFFKLIEPGEKATNEQKAISARLKEMVEEGKLKPVKTIMSLLRFEGINKNAGHLRQTGQTLVKMLADRENQSLASDILQHLDVEKCTTLINLLTANDSGEAGKILTRMLQSKDSAQRHAVASFLVHVDTDHGIDNGKNWIDLFNHEDTRSVAEKALMLAQGRRQTELVSMLLTSPLGCKHIERLSEMSRDLEQRSKIDAILKCGSPGEVSQLFKLMDDPKMAGTCEALIGMLADDDRLRDLSASRLLNLLASRKENDRKVGAAFVVMLNDGDYDKQVKTETLLMRLPFNVEGLADVFSNPKFQHAAAAIAEILSAEEGSRNFNLEGTRIVQTLCELLGTSDSDEGQRILAMLNEPAQKYMAIRLLQSVRHKTKARI